jgi:Fe-S-cluster containining protein
MQLTAKISAVIRLYRSLDRHQNTFRDKSGLVCTAGCGKCCMKPDINATILEFLPAARLMYMSGVYEDILADLEDRSDNKICIFFDPEENEGNCSCYPYRGLICRLFGFSTRIDKYGEKSLLACKEIKKMGANNNLSKHLSHAPVLSEYYMRLFAIDPNLSLQQLPVNECISRAIEIVGLNYRFRKKPA